MKNSKNTVIPMNPRWLLLINLSIAILLVGAAVVLKKSSTNYNSGAQFDRNYIAQTRTETDPATLQDGLLFTEAARSTAYRSVLNISNSAAITWVLVALALAMNCMFIFKMNRRHQLALEAATSA